MGENELRYPNRSDSVQWIDSELGTLIAEASVVFIDRFFQSVVVQGREECIPIKQFFFNIFRGQSPDSERLYGNAP